MRKTTLAAIMLGLAVATPALAGDFYVAASAGRSSIDLNDENLDLVAEGFNVSSSSDHSDTGYKLQAGYQFNRYFAVEGGYVHFGKAKYSAALAKGADQGTLDEVVKVSGFNLVAVGILPLGEDFSLFGKIGAIRVRAEHSFDVDIGADTALESETHTKGRPFFGVGAAYNFTKQLSLRAEYERVNNVVIESGVSPLGSPDVSLFSVGLSYKF